jgi:hypothetical protein
MVTADLTGFQLNPGTYQISFYGPNLGVAGFTNAGGAFKQFNLNDTSVTSPSNLSAGFRLEGTDPPLITDLAAVPGPIAGAGFARPYSCERWPSRLVATAAEAFLNRRTLEPSTFPSLRSLHLYLVIIIIIIAIQLQLE